MHLFAALLVFVVGDTSTWPEFLGRGQQAIVSGSLPVEWGPEKNIAWQSKLPGRGQSSPVVWNGSIFVTSIEGSMKENCQVSSIRVEDGSIQWTKTFPANQTIRSNYFQSRSAPTPIVDRDRVYAFFETGNLIALGHDGTKIWDRALTEDYGIFETTIGIASSPLSVDDKLVLLIDHEGASYVVAIDKETGQTVWKTERDSRVSYASPALISVHGMRQIVCSSAGTIDGYDPKTGELLWSFEEIGGNSQNTPVQVGEGRFLIGAAPGMHNEKEEIASKSNLCLQVIKSQDGYQPSVLWRAEKVMTTFASPMVHQGLAYFVNKAGVVYCLDAETGEQKYLKRLAQQCWATPIGIDDRIYFFGKDGSTTVLASGPEYKLIAENQLWDPGIAPPTSPGGGRSVGHDHEKGTAAKSVEVARKEREQEAREQGENRFADPVQYGVAFTNQGIVVRTGEVVYCVRQK